MSKQDNTLNLQKKLTGHVLIRKGADSWEIPLCYVYGNKKNGLVMMLQDKSDPSTQIQITIDDEQV